MKPGLVWRFAAITALSSGQAAADPREDVVAAMEAMLARDSYRALTTTTIKGAETTVLTTTVEVIPPSRFRVRVEDDEVVIVPEGAWKRVDGRWTPFTEDTSKLVAGFSPDATRRSYERLANVRRVGVEATEGCDATHFVYDTTIEVQGLPMVISTDLWVCDRTGLPIRVTTGDPGGTVTATVVYDFDAAISIAAPELPTESDG